MEIKLDVKTLIIGIAIGVVITAAIGADYGSASRADFGIAVPSATGDGSALVRTSDDGLYIIYPKSAMAIKVLQAGPRAEPYDRREGRNRPFYLNMAAQPQPQPQEKGGNY
jgi:hypothetical protein